MKPLFPALLMALAGLSSGCASLVSSSDRQAMQKAANWRNVMTERAGSFAAIAVGNSNYPVVMPGDMLIVRAKPFSEVGENELIAFIPYGKPDIMVTHFTEVRRWDGWITKGVNNPVNDSNRVNEGNYVGTVEVIHVK